MVTITHGKINTLVLLHFRNQFPDIVKAAYIYILKQTALYLHKPLESTGLPPHFSVAIDKSTPHRDTNQAIMIILQVDGRRVAMPIDAPIVYGYEEDAEGVVNAVIQGGSGKDLAEQVVKVLKTSLQLTADDLRFVRGKISISILYFNIMQALSIISTAP